ncbi:MAG TPA: thrombospondin type 3 repeat-containing protein, partial [Verrucomicrobiae bacterium]|nr:thrombospondin type 3 repeat-containing protein [Verrucomicrobiae bacterium]
PDAWQIQYFGSINSPQAAPNADPDGDGASNLQEYLAGTDPTKGNNYLKIDSVQFNQTQIVIQFSAVAAKTYSVLYASNPNGPWFKLADVPAQSTSHTMTVSDSNNLAGAGRFYRLTTPATP